MRNNSLLRFLTSRRCPFEKDVRDGVVRAEFVDCSRYLVIPRGVLWQGERKTRQFKRHAVLFDLAVGVFVSARFGDKGFQLTVNGKKLC